MQIPTNWTLDDEQIERTFKLKDFAEVMSLLNKIADLANRQNHHPDFHATYDTLTVSITTHATGNTVTNKDIRLATAINEVL